MKRIGIIGGTFNPVHNAHLIIAEHFCNSMKLDICIFIPANISPFKVDDKKANENNTEHRLKMLELAIEGHPKFRIDTYEISKGGVSYSYDTLQYLKNKYPADILFMLIGSDQALSFHDWGNWEKILQIVQVCVALKNEDIEKTSLIESILKNEVHPPVFLNSPLIEISSSIIRRRISDSKPIHNLVPAEVEKYILENRLY
ncbi:MAG: nicotinate (nicotinamide) nucleotide adenylyltransferase [Bacteroidota bacterium]|jgi:nicotinate-nucleotide adenylyltransferase